LIVCIHDQHWHFNRNISKEQRSTTFIADPSEAKEVKMCFNPSIQRGAILWQARAMDNIFSASCLEFKV